MTVAPDDPIERFRELFAAARRGETADATAAALATADASGRPSVRMVLVQAGSMSAGFAFYTNYTAARPATSPEPVRRDLPPLADARGTGSHRGGGRALPADESDAYFAAGRATARSAHGRPTERALAGRDVLEARIRDCEERFGGQRVPRPPFWGGFRLVPSRIEFWSSGEHRLHDRELYRRAGGGWQVERLFP